MTWTAYILQTNLCLILFYLFYYLFLRNETFFRQNRFYLVGASLISFLVPVFQFASVRSLFITQKTYQAVASLDLTYFGTSAEGNTTSSPFDWLLVLYLAGVSVFLCRFLSRLYLTIASGDQATQPYSFFSKVKVPAEIEGRESIHLHETIHVQQWHSADVILFELIAVLNWFNPCAYFIKKEIRHIHEFIADEAAASSQNSKSEYALLLLSNAFGVPPSRLANSFFNDSLIKRRLSMLQKNRSNRTGLLKYGLSAPLFLAMIIFSSATMDQDKALRTIQTELGNLEQLPSAGRAGERSHRADATKSQQKPLQNFQEFYKYTARNVVYPASARASKTEGDVTATFTITPSGKVSNIDILKSPGTSFSDELTRVLNGAGPLDPTFAGQYIFTVSFRLDGSKTNSEEQPVDVPAGYKKLSKVVVSAFRINSVRTTTREEGSQQNNVHDFASVETMPEFKGGMKAFYDYVGKNYSFPAEARKNNVQGRLILSFFVETDGSLSDIRVLRDLGYGTGKAAVELLRKSPAWTPGMNKGKPVRVAYTLPIQLNLEKGKAESLRAPSLSIGSRSDGMSDLERAYIIVDGQEKSYDDIKQIDPATIGSINVLKGKEATEQYGDKGNNGVVIIKTRK